MQCEGANDQCGVRSWLLDACVISYIQATGGASGKALRPPASIGVGVAVVLQRCGPPDGEEGKALREGVASRLLLSVGSARVGDTDRCKIREGAGRRARCPRRRVMIRGDSPDAGGSA